MNELASAPARKPTKLTDSIARQTPLPKGKLNEQGKMIPGEVIIFDGELRGFGLRLREKGSRSWIVQTKIGHKQRRVKIGPVNVLTAAQARDKAKEILANAILGIDKVAEKAQSDAAAANTFGRVAEKFLAFKKANVRPKSYESLERYLSSYMKPLHDVPLSKVDRAMIVSALNTIAKPIARNRARTAISSFFSWALREGYCENNPAIGAGTPAKEYKRERVLSDAEIAKLWVTLEDDCYDDIIKLLLLTGARREEIGGLRHDEVDIVNRQIHLSGARTKNGRALIIPLSLPAFEILAKYMPSNREFVFPRSRTSWSANKRLLVARLNDMAPWRVHDLRHTVVTGMNRLGVQPHIVEAVVNHVSGHKAGIAGRYNHAAYTPEATAALELWAKHVMALVAAIG